MSEVWGGIEGGGTKFVCVLGTGPNDVWATEIIPTTSPEHTLRAAVAFFKRGAERHQLVAVGVGSFGPIDLDQRSPTYGWITTTPKLDWTNTNLVSFLRNELGVPIQLDTDVNCAALGEQRWGAARGLHSSVYFTVGTGIGGAATVDGRLVHGLTHPEMGHIPIAAIEQGARPGVCPYHGGNCLEGVASGPAVQERAGRPFEQIAPDDPIWDEEARYLGYASAIATLMLSPERVIFGGGVLSRQQHLYPRIRAHFLRLLNGYIQTPAVIDQVERYIVAPELGELAGALGALALAVSAH